MKAFYRNTMAKQRSLLGGIIGPTLVLALLGVRCNSTQCETLRDELSVAKRQWSRCNSDLDCVKIGGNPGDCTGILSCDFAVNRSARLEAERRIASLPEETVDCSECTSPNCVGGEIPHCEPISGRCIVVSELIEAGTGNGEGGTSSTGGN
jgi:hypothetical protein